MARREPPLRFRGTPRRLSLSSPALAGHEAGEIVLPEALGARCGGARQVLAVRQRRCQDPEMRLRLAETTPAGRYEAKLYLDGKAVPVQLDIEPVPSLDTFPSRAEFAAKAGKNAAAEITLTNTGNVAVELPEAMVAGLFDDDGLENAFVETYRCDSDDPVVLAGTWLRALRGNHAGLLKIRVAAGAGMLAPGEERTIGLAAQLPETLKPGHSYHGVWKQRPIRLRLHISVQR
jgi:hypothetical protein